MDLLDTLSETPVPGSRRDSENDLVQVQEKTGALLYERLQKRECMDLRKEIDTRGFILSYTMRDLGPEYCFVIAPYYVSLFSFDKDEKTDVELDGSHETQPPWVKELETRYYLTGKEAYTDMDEWEYSDREGDPALGKGKINLCLYCKKEDRNKYKLLVERK